MKMQSKSTEMSLDRGGEDASDKNSGVLIYRWYLKTGGDGLAYRVSIGGP